MTWFETHCHLSAPAFDADREEALSRAWVAGVTTLVEIADGEEAWAKARALSEHPSGRVWWSVGCHPYVADRCDPGLPGRLKEALKHPRAVAVGEIGLDYFKHCAVPRDVQRKTFAALARAGAEADKPLVLHCREADAASTDAQADMLAVLEELFPSPPGGAVRGVAHCFQGTIENARRFVRMGFKVGVDAPITYPKAEGLRELVKALPLEALVLETDSPYLPPQDRRGGRNEPSFLPAVGEALARVKGVSVDDVAAATSRSAAELYRMGVQTHS